MYRLYILFLVIIFCFSSCGEKTKSERREKEISFAAPVSIIASNPFITLLDTCPKPLNIIIPIKGKNNYIIPTNDGLQTISIAPAATHPLLSGEAGGYTFMKTFNTEHGLALSNVSCGYADKMGNLWFGTYGGGVSRYDGKSFTNFTADQGLAGNLIKTIAEDKFGNIWFGTNGSGVSKYDGKSFTKYTTVQGLAGNIVKSITADKTGNIWFCTDFGISKYNPAIKSDLAGKLFLNFTAEQGQVNNFVSSSFEDKSGNIWFGTNAGVYKYNPSASIRPGAKLFTHFATSQGLVNNDITCITEDNYGNILFGTRGGISKYNPAEKDTANGKPFTNYTIEQGLTNNYIHCIKKDKEGNIWFATGAGLSRYDQAANSIINFSTDQGLASNLIFSITEDKTGNLWFGTAGFGLNKYEGKSFTSFSIAQGLVYDKVWSISEDKTGNLWFGTSAGISKYDGKSFSNFSIPYLTANIRSFINDKNGVFWYGSVLGANRYDEKSFINYSLAEGKPLQTVLSIKEDKLGNLWFGTYGNGVYKYDGNRVEAIERRDKNSQQTKRDIQNNGDLQKINGKLVKSFTNFTTAQGLASDIVKCITEDKSGNIWFGTNGYGVSKYDGRQSSGGGMSGTVGEFTNYTTAHGLANNTVLSSMEDSYGNLWFGTDGGLSKYDPEAILSTGSGSFTNYTTAHGLPNNVVYAMVEDTLNNIIWLGTNLGLSGLKLSSLSSGADEVKFENYNINTGYPIKDVNTGALFIDSKGIIWAGTTDKLVRFDYKAIHKNAEAPKVFIQSLEIQAEKISWYYLKYSELLEFGANDQINKNDSLEILNEEIMTFGHLLTSDQQSAMRKKFGDIKFDSIAPFYPLPVNLVLPFKNNNVTFDFVGIETAKPQLVRYQYLLEGYDKDWSPETDKTSATFGNIQEGSYTLKLKAKSPDGIWSQPIIYTFKVLPPWYRTWWMYMSYIFLGLSMISLFFRWRTTSLRKEKEILEKTVKQRTAEVVEQKELVEKKNESIEEKQKEIVDSINYAKRIQYTLLANDKVLEQNLKEHFVLFQPKDIVSGDFYWATKISPPQPSQREGEAPPDLPEAGGNHCTSQTDDLAGNSSSPLGRLGGASRFYLAICDSTGHGVPGAFMSLLNISFLNEAITEKNIKQPHEILNHVRQRLIESISQDGAQDGMDGILLCFESDKITYAAANNAPVIVRNNSIIDLSADKMPIGKGESDQSFTLHTIDTQKGDVLYFYTDGYADQFGGPKGKKFKYKQLENLLIAINQKTMEEQNQLLTATINNWKGDLEQVDDILIIGMRV